MISIRKYLDSPLGAIESAPEALHNRAPQDDLLPVCLDAYRYALVEMGRSSVEACPATGSDLESGMMKAAGRLPACEPGGYNTPAREITPETLAATDAEVRRHIQEWGRSTARHYRQKASEVKAMLMTMAQTAESVSTRDERCGQQLDAVTTQLRKIASLDDISLMRKSIEASAAQLKAAITFMTEQRTKALNELRATVNTFQAKLEEAEQAATSDKLTGLRNRPWIESQLEQRMAAGTHFCVALLDIDDFKGVNDTYGHIVGDELLKQFATELRSACRSSDIVGRWGGDEFIVLLDCSLPQAQAQLERVTRWLCGYYVLEAAAGPLKLNVVASVGIAQNTPPETMKQLIGRADSLMYQNKNATRAAVIEDLRACS